MPDFNNMTELNVGLLSFAALISIILLVGGCIENNRRHTFLHFFNLMLIADIGMLLSEAGIWYFEGSPESITILKICTFFSFCCGYALVTLFCYALIYFVRVRRDVSMKYVHFITIICLTATVLSVASVFNSFLFYFDENAVMQYTDHYWIIEFFDSFTAIAELILVLFYSKPLGRKTTAILSCVTLLPLLMKPLDVIWDTTPSYLMMSLSLIIIYTQFHADLSHQLMEKEKELIQNQISIMLSQIQPHFLFNTLTSIHCLCDKDTAAAKKAIEDFSEYLRGNMDALRQKELISFKEELRHVQIYLNLEKMRFDDELKITYDITANDFFIPALTVQPIVENAVKHGVGEKENGGTVMISAFESESDFIVSIEDNGVGFDTDSDIPQSHIGIRNVQDRLRAMCRGTMSISSTIGKGTKVIISIPKEVGV